MVIHIYIQPSGIFCEFSKYFHNLRSFFIPFCKPVWWSPSFDPSHDSPVIISPSLLLLLCSVLKLLFKKSVVSTVEWDDGRTIFNSVVCICLNILVFLYLFDFLYFVFACTYWSKVVFGFKFKFFSQKCNWNNMYTETYLIITLVLGPWWTVGD